MLQNNLISLSEKYPASNFNLLGNTDVMVNIPDIKSPVVQAIKLSTNESDGDVYVQSKANNAWTDNSGRYHPATPAKYAITKNGLKKLADGAGIKMLSSEHVIPNTCQKCVAVNAHRGQVVQCGNCSCKDIAYHVTIAVPQLTGEILTVEDTHEIIVEDTVIGMSEKQKAEFLKHLPQICEAKALNGAIRTALHIKGTYTFEELQKPFVVAYLVPNLNQDEVKQAAIQNMFESSTRLFGKKKPLDVSQIESRVPEVAMIEASDGENYDQYIDGTYAQETPVYQPAPQQQLPPPNQVPTQMSAPNPQQGLVYQCCECDALIAEKVYHYSNSRFGKPLCYDCQKKYKGGNRR